MPGYVYRGNQTIAEEEVKIKAAARKSATSPSNYIAQIISNRTRYRLRQAHRTEYEYLRRVICGRLDLNLTNPKDANTLRSVVETTIRRRHMEEYEALKSAIRKEVYAEFNYSPGPRGLRESKYEDLIREFVAMDIPLKEDDSETR